MMTLNPIESPWRLRTDVLSTRILLWIAEAGRYGEPTPDVHLYLYDRYRRLALHYENAGHSRRAKVMRQKAEWHYRQSGQDDPPFAAAMALPLPRPQVLTRVIALHPKDDDDEAA